MGNLLAYAGSDLQEQRLRPSYRWTGVVLTILVIASLRTIEISFGCLRWSLLLYAILGSWRESQLEHVLSVGIILSLVGATLPWARSYKNANTIAVATMLFGWFLIVRIASLPYDYSEIAHHA